MSEKNTCESLKNEIRKLNEALTKIRDENADLKNRYDFYRAIFDNAGVAINLVDPEAGKFVEFNRESYESLGYTREEFMDMRLSDIVVSGEAPQLPETLQDSPVISADFESKVITKSGEIRDILVIARFLKLNGKTYFNNIVTDITRLKEIERALKKSEEFSFSILENSPSPIMKINKEFRIEYANPALIRLTGYDPEELLGITFPFPWVDEIVEVETWRAATLKGVKNMEGSFKNKNGERF
ncbi:MAG: PAS domain-containing protein, partial [Candidatus Aminicenantes bacterium]|nr:PAS domain-containing protein [Candidatus Aminicenantes bacterium]